MSAVMPALEQLTGRILMVRPSAFGYNNETACSNTFQRVPGLSADQVQEAAAAEFDAAVAALRGHGVTVHVVDDTPEPAKPDAVFPNNWLTLHHDGRIIIYPMAAPSRRKERRDDILDALRAEFVINEVLDISHHEEDGRFLEGTGSIVFDHAARKAYAAISPRTHRPLLSELCEMIGYQPAAFRACTRDGNEIYHTNVMMCVTDSLAIVATDTVADIADQKRLIASLEEGHDVLQLTMDQVNAFAGNMLAVRREESRSLLIMSETAAGSLRADQEEVIQRHHDVLPIAVPTIEAAGGGSIRCMIAEIFLPLSAEAT